MTFGAAPFGRTPLGAASGEGENNKLASGFTSTTFGTPFGVFDQVGVATGSAPSTTFGSPAVLPGWVPGVAVVTFGTPAAQQVWRAASLGLVTRMPQAYYAFDQTETASGFQATRFGTPVAFRYKPSPVGTLSSAAGFLVTRFGTATAAWTQIPVASGSVVTVLGTPTAFVAGQAAGWASSWFGTPAVTVTCQATSFVLQTFGTHTAMRRQAALPLAVSTRFGTPAVRASDYVAASVRMQARFGRPRARQFFSFPATGFLATSFGSVGSSEVHRVTHMPPVTVFSTPLLLRSTTC